jgi:hypothetical protein
MITNNANVTQSVELSEEEAKREIDIYLEKIQQSFDRFDETHERILATQAETRAILDDINARIARL